MRDALVIARHALTTGDVPVGAIIVNADGVVVGTGSNEREANNDPTAHAEILEMHLHDCKNHDSMDVP
jgi:tRNA(adenine34) deaminase